MRGTQLLFEGMFWAMTNDALRLTDDLWLCVSFLLSSFILSISLCCLWLSLLSCFSNALSLSSSLFKLPTSPSLLCPESVLLSSDFPLSELVLSSTSIWVAMLPMARLLPTMLTPEPLIFLDDAPRKTPLLLGLLSSPIGFPPAAISSLFLLPLFSSPRPSTRISSSFTSFFLMMMTNFGTKIITCMTPTPMNIAKPVMPKNSSG
mmetsp:Transcript_12279/g.25040  ORF Transcript_12279/g.25040 Transcript_12279/m.25040 type:complete len:205 (+) Transcript_12279:140-754(+)